MWLNCSLLYNLYDDFADFLPDQVNNLKCWLVYHMCDLLTTCVSGRQTLLHGCCHIPRLSSKFGL